MTDNTATALGVIFTLIVAYTTPDLGPCARLAATLADGGPVAHVVVYPNGHPCEGGTCQQGECVP